MGRMKDLMMDMDDCIIGAIESGVTSTSDVIAHVKTYKGMADEEYIERYVDEIMGPPQQ